MLDRVVEVVLEDEVFLHVDLHEGVAADNNWRSDGAEDSGPVICAAAEESAVVLNYFCQIKNLIRKVIIFSVKTFHQSGLLKTNGRNLALTDNSSYHFFGVIPSSTTCIHKRLSIVIPSPLAVSYHPNTTSSWKKFNVS